MIIKTTAIPNQYKIMEYYELKEGLKTKTVKPSDITKSMLQCSLALSDYHKEPKSRVKKPVKEGSVFGIIGSDEYVQVRYDGPKCYTILKGSKIAEAFANSANKRIHKKVHYLMDEGIINNDRTFTTDYSFKSASAAVEVITCMNSNGPARMKNDCGKTLKDLLEGY